MYPDQLEDATTSQSPPAWYTSGAPEDPDLLDLRCKEILGREITLESRAPSITRATCLDAPKVNVALGRLPASHTSRPYSIKSSTFPLTLSTRRPSSSQALQSFPEKSLYWLQVAPPPDINYAVLVPHTDPENNLPIVVLYTATAPALHLDLHRDFEVISVRVASLDWKEANPDEQAGASSGGARSASSDTGNFSGIGNLLGHQASAGTSGPKENTTDIDVDHTSRNSTRESDAGSQDPASFGRGKRSKGQRSCNSCQAGLAPSAKRGRRTILPDEPLRSEEGVRDCVHR